MATVPNKDGVGGIDSHIPKIIFAALALANIFTAPQTINAGVTTVNNPALSISQTWNAGGVTFTGFKVNITDTASASGSLLMDLQVGGAAKFNVRKDGSALAYTNGSSALPSIGFNDGTGNYGLYRLSSGQMEMTINNTAGPMFTALSIVAPNNGFVGWSANAAGASMSIDVFLARDAANTLALRNGTNAQAFRVYNTYTDGSNYERGGVRWSSNVLRIGTETAAGTGTQRDVIFDRNGTAYLQFTSNQITAFDDFIPNSNNASDLGDATHTWRNLYMGSWVRMAVTVVGSLPAAATAGAGARMVVSDANAPTFGATVAGGGAVVTPVYSDGTNWKVG